jgi:hypothetical protein
VLLVAKRVVRLCKKLIEVRDAHRLIRMRYGPDLISEVAFIWCTAKGMGLEYIQLNKPDQNSFAKQFNAAYHGQALDD